MILSGVKTDADKFGRGGVFSMLKAEKLGPIPKIEEIRKDTQLIGFALNNVRLKW
jgi:hypothetical protein